MDEARKCRRWRAFRRRQRGPDLRSQGGQAIIEYLLILILSLAFLRFVFFHPDHGLKAQIDKTMLRLGSYLEQNLKSGTKPGGDGEKSLDAFAGTSRWKN